jgi:simple sugar transport system substrate-binding protein
MTKSSRPVSAMPILLVVIATIVSSCAGFPAFAQATLGAKGTVPADPLAIDNARELLKWMYSLPSQSSRRVLSGQDIGHADGPQGYYDYVLGLHERTGKWPAIIGTDYLIHHGSVSFLDVDRKTRILADYWKAGGLVTVYAHLGNPWTGGDAWDTSSGTGRYSDAYTPGTPAYANLKEEFDRLAGIFLDLQSAGVAVLFRPFHEVNGNWFWWHHKDPAQFKNLWRCWYSYLTAQKHVHNLLFVFSPSAPPRLGNTDPSWPWENNPWDYYPGADCVDLVGLSLYFDDPQSMPIRVYEEMLAFGKPFGFGETGSHIPPTPDSRHWDQRRIIRAIKERYPAALFWYSWSSWDPDGFMAMVDLPYAEELMSDPLVATRDDVDFPRVAARIDVPAGPAGKMKVGFIDYGFGQQGGAFSSFESARRSVQEKLGDWLESVPVRGVELSRFGKAVDRLVRQEGCTAIFTNAHPGYDQQVLDAARRYPNVLFEAPQAGGDARPSNLRTCAVDDSEAQYLMGAIAGVITQSGRIGYIGWVAENWQIVKANLFALGVRATNPKARVFLRFAEGHPLEAAKALIAEGCDVFNDAADSDAILEYLKSSASKGKRIYTFGNSTPYEAYPDTMISSQMQNLGVLFERVLGDMHAGKEVPRDTWMGIREGAVRLKAGQVPINPEVTAVLRLKRVRAPDLGEMTAYDFVMRRFEQLRRGDYKPFTGPIKDQQGRLRLPEGVASGTWELGGSIDWLLDNVNGTLPGR